uniref:Uncharacterized protein n=1 Tax=Pristionchus pacificus TaxID=54126 RepID=A0A2A6BPM2_PRIPA
NSTRSRQRISMREHRPKTFLHYEIRGKPRRIPSTRWLPDERKAIH